jgi:hypothetical protein
MRYLRTQEIQEKYRKHMELNRGGPCPLCEAKALKEFQYWKIINNEFPYDRIAQVHHMIIPLRHVEEQHLNDEEVDEYLRIKNEYLFAEYECIIEASGTMKSIPEHHHLHLIITKAE